MDIAVIDPSGFTEPYDHHLCDALGSANCSVRLYSSGSTNWTAENYERIASFYPLTERLPGNPSRPTPGKVLKGLEHTAGMADLLARLARWQPDVIHFQWLPLPPFDLSTLRLFRRIAPLVLTVHDSTPFRGSSTSRLQFFRARSAPRYFEKVIVHTQMTREELIDDGYSTERISVIPHGVLNYPTTQADRRPEVMPDEELCILFFGMIKEYKGVDVLLEGFAAMPDDVCERSQLVIAGKPRLDMGPLRNLADELGITDSVRWELEFIPHDKVASYFALSDVVIFPYRHIDQSGALMTALPFGVPIVATDVGGISEVITSGVHGHLVPPCDPEALSGALSSILTDEERRQEMASNTAELARTDFSWERIADETIELYNQLG